jgi:PTS system nitrogen regulatory IIA component
MNLSDYISADRIVFLKANGRDDAIRELIEQAASLSLIRNKSDFESTVRRRETVSPTGIGLGVAIPHGRCREAVDLFIITGLAPSPLQWPAFDGAPVKMIFLIGIPDGPTVSTRDMAGRYLALIAALMLLIKQPRRREAMFAALKPEDLLAVLSQAPQPTSGAG